MGWLLSAAFHAMLILGATLVFIEQLWPFDGPTGIACGLSLPLPQVPEIERPRDVFERSGLIPDDGWAFEPAMDSAFTYGQPKEGAPRGGDEGQDLSSASWSLGSSATPGMSAGSGPQRAAEWKTLGFRSRGCGISRISSRCRYPCTDSAVTASLRWLARHQNSDGSWSSDGYNRHCVQASCAGAGDREFDEGVTSLALLAFLGAGYSQLSRDVLADPAFPDRPIAMGETVKKGLQWLLSRQDAEGAVGARGSKFMYNHAIATLALSEAYGLTASAVLQAPAQAALDFLAAARNPGAGWRYAVRGGENDTSVTGWAVMALKSAELSGLTFPRAAATDAVAWIEKATEPGPSPRVGYTQAGSGKVYIPGRNEQFDDHPTMSAVGLLSRILIRKDRRDAGLAAALVADLPVWKENRIDFYAWYYSSLALFQFDGPAGPCWKKWSQPAKDTLVLQQKLAKSGCENGSWDPSVDRWGSEGGRVYATAINTLTLEIYYRYAAVFGGNRN